MTKKGKKLLSGTSKMHVFATPFLSEAFLDNNLAIAYDATSA